MQVISKAGQFAVKQVESKDGKSTFYVVEKSRKNEQSGEWETQSIFLKPAEMAVVAELLFAAFATLAREFAIMQNNKQTGGADY